MWRLKSTSRHSYVLKTRWNEFVKGNKKDLKPLNKFDILVQALTSHNFHWRSKLDPFTISHFSAVTDLLRGSSGTTPNDEAPTWPLAQQFKREKEGGKIVGLVTLQRWH